MLGLPSMVKSPSYRPFLGTLNKSGRLIPKKDLNLEKSPSAVGALILGVWFWGIGGHI